MSTSTSSISNPQCEREYRCGACLKITTRDDLVVKRAVFVAMGVGGRTIRSRSLLWLCSECLESDPDWAREPWSASPGQQSQ